jgi:hypothetical protein
MYAGECSSIANRTVDDNDQLRKADGGTMPDVDGRIRPSSEESGEEDHRIASPANVGRERSDANATVQRGNQAQQGKARSRWIKENAWSNN